MISILYHDDSYHAVPLTNYVVDLTWHSRTCIDCLFIPYTYILPTLTVMV